MKPLLRAVEKALGCYGGDVSYLKDLCRARIILPDAAAAAACLDRIGADSEFGLVVLKLRNTAVDTGYASRNAGFRVSFFYRPVLQFICLSSF